MGPCEMTVVATVYNQSLADIRKTLTSIAAQKCCEYELLVGDDHSLEDKSVEIEALCIELGIENYKLIRHEQNLKTVGNILECLKFAQGSYVKVIGSGDTLYSESTLEEIVAFCRRHDVRAGFGDVLIENTGERMAAPRNIDAFELGSTSNRARLLKHALMWGDWIPGGSQFFEKDYFIFLLSKLYHDFGVRYCEDFAQIVALGERMVYHLAAPVLVYDNEGGISTSGSMDSRRRMYNDHLSLYRGMKKERPLGISLGKENALFNLKRFIALKTPAYSLFQKLIMKSYSKQNSTDDHN